MPDINGGLPLPLPFAHRASVGRSPYGWGRRRSTRLANAAGLVEVLYRNGATNPRLLALFRLEAGGAVPTIPVLERIAIALGAELIVTIAPHAA